MTAQINDSCFHRKIDFDVAGISGSGLFDPAAIGVEPVAVCSACWRGFVTHYSILDGELNLTGLDLGLSQQDAIRARAGKGPELFGVLPKAGGLAGFVYKGFRSPVHFTGGLLLGNDFIRELYVHMGFHPVWKYKDVREVIFDAGRVIEDIDRSSEMAVARTKIVDDAKCSQKRPTQPTRDDIKAWIEKSFSRDY